MAEKRISESMEQLLNQQMTKEAYQAQVYLSYGAWAEENGFAGISAFLYKHSREERDHMFKILKYVINRGGSANLAAIDAVPKNPKDLKDCLAKTLQAEIDNSASINTIVNLAHEERDWATFNFAQWFVQEQIEEETLINNLIDNYNLASEQSEHANLYPLDRDTAGMSQEAMIPREES